jgi:hypothetical protein
MAIWKKAYDVVKYGVPQGPAAPPGAHSAEHLPAYKLDLTTPHPPVSASVADPQPQDAQEARKILDGAFRKQRSSVDAKRRALGDAEKQYASAVDRARRQRDEARTPNKIASLGVLQRLTLTETTLETPKGHYALSEGVHAHAEQHGNKQVVQGWVLKSDSDRREIYFHADGPDWGVVVPFSMKHTMVQPAQLHEFANKVNVAARNVTKAKDTIRSRGFRGDRELAAAIAGREAVQRAAQDLVSDGPDLQALLSAQRAAGRLAGDDDSVDKDVRKLGEVLTKVRQQLAAWADEATELQSRVAQESAAAETEAAKINERVAIMSTPVAEIAPDPPPVPPLVVPQDTLSTAAVEGDVFEQIRKLAELRDAGLVTPEEFQAKKSELLSRL